MFIYVGCAGGSTSSMFCQRIVKEIEENDANLSAVFADARTINQKQVAYGEKYDLVFSFGGVGAIEKHSAFEFGKLFDVVFIAPQVRYLTESKQKLLAEYPTVVSDIPAEIFGMMDGKKAYDGLLEQLVTLDDQRAYQSSIISPTKSADKNIELFVIGNKGESFFKGLQNYWESQAIRCHVENYSLENLYQFEPKKDFDIRLIFGSIKDLNKSDFPKIARRIDGVLAIPQASLAIKEKVQWLADYQIPLKVIDSKHFYKGSIHECGDELLDFLYEVQVKTEYTTDITVRYLEEQKLKPRKTFLKIFSWE